MRSLSKCSKEGDLATLFRISAHLSHIASLSGLAVVAHLLFRLILHAKGRLMQPFNTPRRRNAVLTHLFASRASRGVHVIKSFIGARLWSTTLFINEASQRFLTAPGLPMS